MFRVSRIDPAYAAVSGIARSMLRVIITRAGILKPAFPYFMAARFSGSLCGSG